MIEVKNIGKRLITFKHDGKRYPVKCGLDNVASVPNEVVQSAFYKALEAAQEVVSLGAVDDTAEESERYKELKALKVGELRDMAKDIYGISGTSRMNEDKVINAIIEAENAE